MLPILDVVLVAPAAFTILSLLARTTLDAHRVALRSRARARARRTDAALARLNRTPVTYRLPA